MSKLKIVVTGGSGFLGRALLGQLCSEYPDYVVVATLRRAIIDLPGGVIPIQVGSLFSDTDWRQALYKANVVIHTAARVHVMAEIANDPLAEFRKINVEATLNLARQAAEAGVRRFIFISSIKVNGENNVGEPFSENDKPAPRDAYGLSKWEAEEGLTNIAEETGLEVVTLRSPLIYGPGVSANFLRLLKLINMEIPLPFDSLKNQRSMIYIANFVDAIISCLDNPRAAGETFLVSDGTDVSTPQLISYLAKFMGKKNHLFYCPMAVLKYIFKFLCKSAEFDRLAGSLQLDSGKIRDRLGWVPPYSMEEGIAETVKWYIDGLDGGHRFSI